MMLIGDKKEMILLLELGRGRHTLACFGRKAHYRADGTCKHTDAVLARIKPWHRARTKVDGWGGLK